MTLALKLEDDSSSKMGKYQSCILQDILNCGQENAKSEMDGKKCLSIYYTIRTLHKVK